MTGDSDGSASLHYRLPSVLFAAYENTEIDAMATELDRIWVSIVEDATGG